MVNPVSSGSQPTYATSQPSFTSGAEVKANTEQVQPRQAPAADTQRAAARESKNDDVTVEFRDRKPETTEEAPPERRADNGRGSLVDLNV